MKNYIKLYLLVGLTRIENFIDGRLIDLENFLGIAERHSNKFLEGIEGIKRCEICDEIIDRDWEEGQNRYCENNNQCFMCWEGRR